VTYACLDYSTMFPRPGASRGLFYSTAGALTRQRKYDTSGIAMKNYSTATVAAGVGVSKLTLTRWLKAGKIKEPRRVKQGGIELRLWTNRDVERVQKYKEANYRKGRGRKPKPKR
jgi:hypothetical protein